LFLEQEERRARPEHDYNYDYSKRGETLAPHVAPVVRNYSYELHSDRAGTIDTYQDSDDEGYEWTFSPEDGKKIKVLKPGAAPKTLSMGSDYTDLMSSY
jgi:hypothetical protein